MPHMYSIIYMGPVRECSLLSPSLRRLSETMEISEIRVLMKYEFLCGATTRQALANINSEFGIQVATNTTVACWFKKFRLGDFDLSNERRGRSQTGVDDDVLKAAVEANSNQSALFVLEHPKRWAISINSYSISA
ncbi:mariner-7 protein [Nephila pilipes]|uniref:Mariner-7 protein n=1 Tax=Nephila pilipes TaxID=299642 RepID=A0A8X6MSY2_NEPPI|nr:mariner-7 protein [Nephila pilipes]